MFAYRAATNSSGRGLLALWGGAISRRTDPSRRSVDSCRTSWPPWAPRSSASSPATISPHWSTWLPMPCWECGSARHGPRRRRRMLATPRIRVLDAAASQRPIVCVVDDVQWAQPSTVGAMLDLAASDAADRARGRRAPRSGARRVSRSRRIGRSCSPSSMSTRFASSSGTLDFEPDAEARRADLVPRRRPPAAARRHRRVDRAVGDPRVRLLAGLGSGAPRGRWRMVLLAGSPSSARRRCSQSSAASVLGPSFSPPLLADMIDLDERRARGSDRGRDHRT